jgi:hypothetical protein
MRKKILNLQAMCVFEDVEESLEGLVQKKFGPMIL